MNPTNVPAAVGQDHSRFNIYSSLLDLKGRNRTRRLPRGIHHVIYPYILLAACCTRNLG